MTVTTQQVASIPVLADGVNRVWGFEFRVMGPSEVLLEITTSDSKFEVTSGLVVQLNSSGVGGTITYPDAGAPLAAGTSVRVVRRTKIQQLTEFGNQAAFLPELHDDAFDRLTLVAQEIRVAAGDIEGKLDLINDAVAASALSEAQAEAAAEAAQATVQIVTDARDAAQASAVAAAASASASLVNSASRAVASATNFPASIGYVRTAGYAAAGDKGAALYKRVGAQPGHLGRFQSADGAWWELVADFVTPAMVGGSPQTAIDVAAALSLRSVILQGTYVLTAPLALRPGVIVAAVPGAATLTQANGAGLASLVSWTTNAAHGAGIDGLVLDMNRANNVNNVGHAAATAHTIDDPSVKNCRFLGSTGHGVLMTDTLRPIIENNVVDNCFVSGIYVYGVARTSQNNARIEKNRVSKWGQHAIVTWNVQNSRVLNNECIGYSQKTTCHIDDNLVVWVSGPKFDNVQPGEFVIGIHSGGYFEALVLSKQGNTQLTVNYVIGDYFNVPCVIGNGDVISISGSRDELIQGNTVIGGASLGISLFSTAQSSQDRSKVIGNTVIGTMASGYSLQVADLAYLCRDNIFLGNTAIDTGQGGAAMDSFYRSGMSAVLGNNGLRNIIDDNSWISYGAGMVDGLRVGGAAGAVLVGDNQSTGVTEGIANGASITLGAGWGTGAGVANIFCYGDLIFFTVISGSAPAANPTITINHVALPIRRKRPTLQMTSTPSNLFQCITFYPDPEASSVFTILGTPAAGSNGYQFVFRF